MVLVKSIWVNMGYVDHIYMLIKAISKTMGCCISCQVYIFIHRRWKSFCQLTYKEKYKSFVFVICICYQNLCWYSYRTIGICIMYIWYIVVLVFYLIFYEMKYLLATPAQSWRSLVSFSSCNENPIVAALTLDALSKGNVCFGSPEK